MDYLVGGYSIVSCDNKYGVINNSTDAELIQLDYSEINILMLSNMQRDLIKSGV